MKKIHFIAIGGSVMHQLAITLKNKGYTITGSDDEIYEPAHSNLEKAGLLPTDEGWHPEKITPELDAIILGMHSRNENPELQKARSLNIPVYSFPEYIYEESRQKERVVVGGSHGKTTITSMILHVLNQCGRDFDYLVGAQLPGFDYSVKLSNAPVIICEGDEYPASAIQKIPKFLFYHPQIAVLSGIAWDHINVFPTFENYVEQFAMFIMEMQPGATLIYNGTDPQLVKVVEKEGTHLQLIPYKIPAYHIENGKTIVQFGNHSATLEVFGSHNLQNLQAAKLVCGKLGVSEADFLHAISSFKGASKRLEKMFEAPDAILYRDFAHAPSKVKASVHAVKEQFPDRKLIAILELHTYSSLNATFLPEYHNAMQEADSAVVFYSRHALSIKHLPDLSFEMIRQGFNRNDLHIINDLEELKLFISLAPARDANLLMMSSGSFGNTTMDEIIRLWQKK
ncbi:MAG: peptidoglycan synthetase [Chitinophagaceae bacterium]|nr:MAG: peptidoglycan synthetase [Chitinophagaceae bacterium]